MVHLYSCVYNESEETLVFLVRKEKTRRKKGEEEKKHNLIMEIYIALLATQSAL